jgi:hypothetical protein
MGHCATPVSIESQHIVIPHPEQLVEIVGQRRDGFWGKLLLHPGQRLEHRKLSLREQLAENER